jgi:hypothetical protein
MRVGISASDEGGEIAFIAFRKCAESRKEASKEGSQGVIFDVSVAEGGEEIGRVLAGNGGILYAIGLAGERIREPAGVAGYGGVTDEVSEAGGFTLIFSPAIGNRRVLGFN